MKPKSKKENEFPEKKAAPNFSKTSSKKKEKGASSKKTSKTVNDDDDVVVVVEIEDDWEIADDDEDFDPDFEELDISKSKIKKPSAKKGKGDEDFYMDEDFKAIDLFNDGTDAYDDEDDF